MKQNRKPNAVLFTFKINVNTCSCLTSYRTEALREISRRATVLQLLFGRRLFVLCIYKM